MTEGHELKKELDYIDASSLTSYASGDDKIVE